MSYRSRDKGLLCLSIFLMLLDLSLSILSLVTFSEEPGECCNEPLQFNHRAYFWLSVAYLIILVIEFLPVVWWQETMVAMLNPLISSTLTLGMVQFTSLSEGIGTWVATFVALIIDACLLANVEKKHGKGFLFKFGVVVLGLNVLYLAFVAMVLYGNVYHGGVCYDGGQFKWWYHFSMDCYLCPDGTPYKFGKDCGFGSSFGLNIDLDLGTYCSDSEEESFCFIKY